MIAGTAGKVRRAGGSLAHGRIDRRRLVLGNHHCGRARRRRAAQAGAQVVRVLHAIQHQHQRLAFGRFNQAGQLAFVPGLRRRIARDRALVADRTADTVQRLLGDPAHLDALAPRVLLDLGDARILAAGLQQDFAHVVGIVVDGRSHRVDAGDPLVLFAHNGNGE